MLQALIRFSIQRAALVVILACVLLGYSAMRLVQMPVDVFPELNAPTVVVLAEAPGLAADEVEQFVTLPVESAVGGTPGVRRVRTTSSMGLSIAYVEFEWGEDIYRARQLVAERLDAVRDELPPEAHVGMTPITSVTGEIMLLAVSSYTGRRTPMELRSFAEFDLRRRLLGVPGVAQVSVLGGDLPEYQVLVDQDRLRLFGLTLEDVARAAGAANNTSSAGYLENVGGLEIPIRQSGRVRSVQDIERTLIGLHEGAPLTIGQVAEVRLGPALRRGTGADGGAPAVILTVQKSPGTNTLALTAQIDQLLEDLEPSLPADLKVNREVFRQADFIQNAVNNVVEALIDAALIVCVILVLFLLNLRTTLITLLALPLSLAAGLLALDALGLSINVMTLGGLAIAVGSLVDDAIIDVENVFRRLRQNAALPAADQRPRLDVLFEASNEIRPAMVFATVIICLVFLPLTFLGGIEGRFFRPLGLAFVVSILASLFVALTVTPALCRLLLDPRAPTGKAREGFLVRGCKALYAPLLGLALRFKGLVLFTGALAAALSLWLGSTFGSAFLPEFNEGTFLVQLFAPAGTSLQASDRMAGAVERQLLQLEGVRSVTRRTGRAERDEHAEPVGNSEIDLTLAEGASRTAVRQRISAVLERVPGITTNVGQPIEHRLSHVLSGTPAAIAINVYGDDLDVLREVASEIDAALEALPGTRDVNASREQRIETLPVRFRPDLLAAYGLTPVAAAAQVRDAISGVTVGEVRDGPRRYDLTVRLEDAAREDVADLSSLILTGTGGALVRLEEVAGIGPELASNRIVRENSQRKAVISLNVAEGYNLGHLVAEVSRVVDPIAARYRVRVHYGGQFEAQQSASRAILGAGAVVLALMLVLLHLAIGSLRVSLLVLVNLPLALIGGIVAVFISQSSNPIANLAALLGTGDYTAPVLSIASLVGFITLFGIAVRNGILLVNHYRTLIEVEGCGLDEAIRRGSLERLVPILMTALTAALALLPIVLEGEQPGNEILSPLSVVILGGLLSSTFLNLLVVPAGYRAIHAGSMKRG